MGRALLLCLLCFLCLLPSLAGGGEGPARSPGALPVTDGLELWLDAARLEAGGPARPEGAPLEAWPDASGRGRDAVAPSAAARPRRVALATADGPRPAVRFDGADDHLRLALPARGVELPGLTCFVVAAPRSNWGGFRAFLSLSEEGRNDYTHGLNIDLGGAGGDALDVLNVEGKGLSGQRDLLEGSLPLGSFHVLCLTAAEGEGATRLFVDGALAGEREPLAAALRVQRGYVGARYYSNTPDPQAPSGFIAADIAEVIAYGRVLADEERRAVEARLRVKHAGLLALEGSAPEPFLRVLVPGFEARELPVELSNANDLLYLPDGRLLALGYDGRIHALRDTDSDGFEEDLEPYWEGPPLRVPLQMALGERGLYVTSHGKVSLLRDEDGDGRAEREVVLAQGWEPPDVFTGPGVDALGIAVGRGESVYFSLGCFDFTNPYRLKDGRPRYDARGERGTILRLAPGSGDPGALGAAGAPGGAAGREALCAGVRFAVAMAFNRHGDLFFTDQEGETWCPRGNPLDELDCLVAGRHYGFPPRHETYLPDVVEEPPVVAFGPQHQSACGLIFNEPRPGGRPFGPPAWEGDAFVAGYSRGKLWRARLVKTPEGYVGSSQLVAASSLLLLEMALAPSGDLAVACHGGAPDWGSGPSGKGHLFKLSWSRREAPQPVIAWATGPLEARVAFDRPLDPGALEALRGATISFGEHVRAGDRFEVQQPGYASVRLQGEAPVGSLRVSSAGLSGDGRTLVLRTDPHPARAVYALTLSGIGPAGRVGPGGPAGPEAAPEDAELAYDLCGVEARWSSSETGAEGWSGWLPHLDLEVCRALTRGSAGHDRLFACLERPGSLELKARVDLPAGARLVPADGVRLDVRPEEDPELEGDAPREVRLAAATGEGRPPATRVAWRREGDPAPRPIPLEMLLLPWAPDRPPEAPEGPRGPPPELAGADPRRGEALFFGPEARCSACHKVRGKGGAIGPDLSNLEHRDPASVLRDIREPSAAIHPDHAAFTAVLRDGRVATGIVRAEGPEGLRIADASAQELAVRPEEVLALEPSSESVMPKGLDLLLGPERLRDLLAFLLGLEAPEPAAEPGSSPDPSSIPGPGLAPPPAPETDPGALDVLLVAGPKDHGPGEHDYPAWQRRWKALLATVPGVKVETAWMWPSAEQWARADVAALFFWNHGWGDEHYRDLDRFLERGGGLVALHSAVIPPKEPEGLAARLGLAWRHGTTKFRHGPLDLAVPVAAEHPIVRGISRMAFLDESYWPLVGEPSKVAVLATQVEDGAPQPMLWAREAGKGRVVATLLGHYLSTFDDPLFRLVFLRSLAWAARVPEERFQPLVTGGVRFPVERWSGFLERAAAECAALRRELLASRDGKPGRAAALAAAIGRFIDQARPRLAGRRPIDAFREAARDLEAQVRGAGRVAPAAAFGAFAGSWHGLWRDLKVDHRWGEAIEQFPPRAVGSEGSAVHVRGYQLAWVGDGYGVNLLATDDPGDKGKDHILGYVVHVKDGDLTKEAARRPHVGVHAGPGKLIWVTAAEVFLEEAYATGAGADEYAITGFRYTFEDGAVEAKEGFQAVYTREPERRPAFQAFPWSAGARE